MKALLHSLAVLLLFTGKLSGGIPTGKPQQLTSPDQVPEGLAKSDWQSIRAAYEAGRHVFSPIKGGWQARNPGMGWQMTFDDKGFTARPDDGAWIWGLELEVDDKVVRGFSPQKMPSRAEALDYTHSHQRTAAITEWFVNDRCGLEQGWTLTAPAEIRLRVRGNLKPTISAQSISFGGQVAYSGLKAWDAVGRTVPTRFEATADGFAVCYDDTAARYPITIDPIAQQAYLKPAAVGTSQANDQFGNSVAVSGDTVVVGAWQESSSSTGINSTPNESAFMAGAAYVFVRNGATWTQQAYLKPAAGVADQTVDQFGGAVAISGDTVVVGATGEGSGPTSGAAYVFVRSGTIWTQQAFLKASGVPSAGSFGSSVAISGDTIAVGARGGTGNAGNAFVFVRSGTTWTQQANLSPADIGTTQSGDFFGTSIGVSGDTVVVGALWEASSTTGVNSTPNESASGAGAAYVFVRSGTTWTQQAYLKASQVSVQDFFGYAVAVSGDTVVVGANGEDSSTTGVNSTPDESASQAGAAYVFVRSGATWTQQAYLKPAAFAVTQTGAAFGISLAVSGDRLVVGAFGESSSTTGVNSTPNFGTGQAGAAYVFERNGTTWTQQAYLKASQVSVQDSFGWSVAVSGDIVVAGAKGEDSSTTGIDSTPNESAGEAGAAYIFSGFGTGGDADNDGLLDSWELTYWPTTTGHNALDDSDHDGYCELLELAFGLNPMLPNAGGLPAAVNEDGYLTMTITKRAGVTYEVQSAGSLQPALPDSFSASTTTVITDNATTLKVRDNFLIGTSPGRFMRVKVTAAP